MVGHGRIQDVVRGSLVPGACVRRAQARKRRRRRSLQSKDPTATGTLVRTCFLSLRPAGDYYLRRRLNQAGAPPGKRRSCSTACWVGRRLRRTLSGGDRSSGPMTEFRISERCMLFLCLSDSGFRLFFRVACIYSKRMLTRTCSGFSIA
jgi:hypothetical protein